MGILYRQENNGYKHVIELKGEDWEYEDYDEMEEVMDWLCKHTIPFAVNYSFELYHIVIEKASWSITVTERQNAKKVKTADAEVMKVFKDLVKWKTWGTRPKEIEVDFNLTANTVTSGATYTVSSSSTTGFNSGGK